MHELGSNSTFRVQQRQVLVAERVLNPNPVLSGAVEAQEVGSGGTAGVPQ